MEIDNKKIFLLEEIVKKNFSAKYKDSVLGILWSFIKPLLIMILLTIIFSSVFGRAVQNYSVYVLSGKCMFDFFNAGTNMSIGALINNQNILKRTPAPKHIFVLGGIFSEFINFIITLIILIGVMIVTKAPFYPTMILSIIPIVIMLIAMIGLGLMLSIACVYYKDIMHIWSVIMMALMYASAIFYPINIIPEPFYSIMILNPVYWVIEQFRDFVYLGIMPNLLNVINSFLIALMLFVLGIIIFKKYEKKVIMKF